MSQDLYREYILDHYKHPRNKGALEEPTAKARDTNPLCGDVIEIQLKINAEGIQDIRFQGQGCAISQASASMLTEMVKGKTLDEARAINKETILEEMGIDPGPARIKCAMLSLKVLKMAIYLHLAKDIKITEMGEETEVAKPAN